MKLTRNGRKTFYGRYDPTVYARVVAVSEDGAELEVEAQQTAPEVDFER